MLIEPECGHVDQASNARHAASIRECSRRQVMHSLVRFSATLAQDADAVHNYIDIQEYRLPCIGGQQLLEPDRAAFATMRLHWKTARSTLRISAADNDVVLTTQQR
jgi:hypothetical protein